MQSASRSALRRAVARCSPTRSDSSPQAARRPALGPILFCGSSATPARHGNGGRSTPNGHARTGRHRPSPPIAGATETWLRGRFRHASQSEALGADEVHREQGLGTGFGLPVGKRPADVEVAHLSGAGWAGEAMLAHAAPAGLLVRLSGVCDGRCRHGAGELVVPLGFMLVHEIEPQRPSVSRAEQYPGRRRAGEPDHKEGRREAGPATGSEALWTSLASTSAEQSSTQPFSSASASGTAHSPTPKPASISHCLAGAPPARPCCSLARLYRGHRQLGPGPGGSPARRGVRVSVVNPRAQ